MKTRIALLLLLLTISAQSQSVLPSAPQVHESGKKLELEAHIFSFAATIVDVETTARLTRGETQCHELNSFIVGKHPDRARLYATSIPVSIVASLLAHRMRSRGSGKWALFPLLNGAGHVGGLLVNGFAGC